MRLKEKIALITGAASGIGYAVTTLFAGEGATVYATDIASPKTSYPAGVEARCPRSARESLADARHPIVTPLLCCSAPATSAAVSVASTKAIKPRMNQPVPATPRNEDFQVIRVPPLGNGSSVVSPR